MPYARPTLTQLINQALNDITTAGIDGVDGLLPIAVLRVLALTEAGFAHLHYGYLDRISKNAVPYTAEEEYLEGWAALKGVTRKAASNASGTVTFNGSAGASLAAGVGLVRADGAAYTTTSAGTVDSGLTVTVSAQADDTGEAGNCAAGTAFSLSSSVTGITSSSGVAATVFTGGADQETDEDLRSRMLLVYATSPQGGDKSDYVNWAEEVSGVTRAWCNPLGAGAGTVVVYVMLDDANSAYAGFPQGTNGGASQEARVAAATGDQLAVADHLYDLQPVTALVTVCAPVARPVDFTIENLSPNNATIQAEIKSALTEMFLEVGSPLGMTLYSSYWEAAIANVAGVDYFNITAPTGNLAIDVGSLPVLGTLTFSSAS